MDFTAKNAHGAIGAVADVSMDEHTVSSLEERMLLAYAQAAFSVEEEQRQVFQKLQQDSVTSDPAQLFELQQRTAEYNLQVSLMSTLVRKGVSTVETLLRS